MSEKIRDVSSGRPTQIVSIMKFVQINRFVIVVNKCEKKLCLIENFARIFAESY